MTVFCPQHGDLADADIVRLLRPVKSGAMLVRTLCGHGEHGKRARELLAQQQALPSRADDVKGTT